MDKIPKRYVANAEVMARFIVGWWPGLEGGLTWPDDADHPEDNSVYTAATRILAFRDREEKK